jgi:putative DNA primase/helicase
LGNKGIPKKILEMRNWVSTDTKSGTPNTSISKNLFNFQETITPGFVFNHQHNISGVDIDDCITISQDCQGKMINKQALYFIQKFDSYTEISRSGTGIHILFEADKAKIAKVMGDERQGVRKKIGTVGWEFYIAGRQFIITGNSNGKDIRYIKFHELTEFLDFMIPKRQQPKASGVSLSMDDEAIIRIISRSKQKDKFLELWNRDAVDGNSDGDMGLAGMLAFYTQDIEQLVRIIRSSPCGQRKKFDRDNYIYRLAQKAIDNRSGTYEVRRNSYA